MNAREIYQRTKKPRDLAWNVYVCRPLAALVVLAVHNTKITPNQVTLLSACIAGLAALLVLVLPGYLGILIAIVVYEFSYVLDCVDGMLARLRNTQSIQGHLLDFLMDELKAFLMLAAVSVRLFLDSANVAMLLIGMGGLVALAAGVGMTSFLRRPETARESGAPMAPTPLGAALRWAETVGHWGIHYPSYIWLAALLGRLEWYLYPYVIVNVAYSGRAFLGIAFRFGRAATVPPQSRETPPPSSVDTAG